MKLFMQYGGTKKFDAIRSLRYVTGAGLDEGLQAIEKGCYVTPLQYIRVVSNYLQLCTIGKCNRWNDFYYTEREAPRIPDLSSQNSVVFKGREG
jgi:hypothetical protein